MARIRTFKPDLWNDEKLGNEPESIVLTFLGLWTYSDDYGVVKANPVLLKNQIFPYKDKLRIDAFSTWLNRLEELNRIVPFLYRGERFYFIRNFRKHQKIDKPSKARNCPEQELIKLVSIEDSEGTPLLHSPSTPLQISEYSTKDKDIGRDIGKEGIITASPEKEKTPFSKFQEWIVDHAHRVSKMKEPFTQEQFEKLQRVPPLEIAEMLKKMHNHEPLFKNRSAYLTFLNWKKRDEKRT